MISFFKTRRFMNKTRLITLATSVCVAQSVAWAIGGPEDEPQPDASIQTSVTAAAPAAPTVATQAPAEPQWINNLREKQFSEEDFELLKDAVELCRMISPKLQQESIKGDPIIEELWHKHFGTPGQDIAVSHFPGYQKTPDNMFDDFFVANPPSAGHLSRFFQVYGRIVNIDSEHDQKIAAFLNQFQSMQQTSLSLTQTPAPRFERQWPWILASNPKELTITFTDIQSFSTQEAQTLFQRLCHLPELKLLRLANYPFTPERLQGFQNSIQRVESYPQLRTLEIIGGNMEGDHILRVFPPTLTSFFLVMPSLSMEDIKTLVSHLPDGIETLKFAQGRSHKVIASQDIVEFLDLLNQKPSLATFALTNLKIEDAGAQIIADRLRALELPNLQKLSLYSTGLSDAGVKYISNAITSSGRQQSLKFCFK